MSSFPSALQMPWLEEADLPRRLTVHSLSWPWSVLPPLPGICRDDSYPKRSGSNSRRLPVAAKFSGRESETELETYDVKMPRFERYKADSVSSLSALSPSVSLDLSHSISPDFPPTLATVNAGSSV